MQKRNRPPTGPLEGELTIDELALELDLNRSAVSARYNNAKRRFEHNWKLWRLVFDSNLDTNPELASSVVEACRSLIKALDKRERRERGITLHKGR